ncbi:hypothetical protein [Sulfuricella sp. T08]|uniref:hypothetical protein n=1 Tax=Sulfuricella sp. T08 TaxID=1632857 RepID=UPI000751A250|nr:hypothetical protein [Sulfuricella sp. T08]
MKCHDRDRRKHGKTKKKTRAYHYVGASSRPQAIPTQLDIKSAFQNDQDQANGTNDRNNDSSPSSARPVALSRGLLASPVAIMTITEGTPDTRLNRSIAKAISDTTEATRMAE